MNDDAEFAEFFARLTGGNEPRGWQRDLASHVVCSNRLIRIPTGFGKTLGVVAAWLWRTRHPGEPRWPRRLVICLPMRVLVEQTEHEVREALERLGLLWNGQGDHAGKVGVHTLMGGTDNGDWYLYPEDRAVLIGTQDMVLSRALNRGYGAPRARWPAEFGLLSQDTLWVMDEVQLMDVGLATSAQLQAFRDDDRERARSICACFSWWMSATLQLDWLRKSPDTARLSESLPQTRINGDQRHGHLWDDVSKPCQLEAVKDDKALASFVAKEHVACGRGKDGPTLVVVNTVKRAVAVFGALTNDKSCADVDLRLVHSRFRPVERAGWREAFLNRAACAPGTNRIVVATQVIEAGVDISAAFLVTELAPWASLVQRFGRSARWGGAARVIIADFGHKDDKAAAPYSCAALDAAREVLTHVNDAAPLHLEAFEESHPELLAGLYPYEPKHLILRNELDELFDTTPDLSGADVDISRFIRSGDERDLQVFWADVPVNTSPADELQPSREALCSVPFLAAREWLFDGKGDRFKSGRQAWTWDWIDGEWQRAKQRDLFPGRVVLVSSASGGYDRTQGWLPASTKRVSPVTVPGMNDLDEAAQRTDASEADEALSQHAYQTIAVHGREVGALARRIAEIVAPEYADLSDLAGRVHDVGKAHPAFNNSIIDPPGGPTRPDRRDLAKAPKGAWLPLSKFYPMEGGRRAGFRHELASTLALFNVLHRHAPDHEAMLGPWRAWLTAAGLAPPAPENAATPPSRVEREIFGLTASRFNLLAYLVCAHHGKVRVSWHASPADQATNATVPRIRGVQDGDQLPALQLMTTDGGVETFPASDLSLAPAAAGLNSSTGAGWTERVLGLLEAFGPFTLAWLEALLIAADRRTSRRTDVRDELLQPEVIG